MSSTKPRPPSWTYRLLAEIDAGRLVENHEVVHHRDHNPHNNDPTNLEIMAKSTHARLHPERWMNQRAKLSDHERSILRKYAPNSKWKSRELQQFKDENC